MAYADMETTAGLITDSSLSKAMAIAFHASSATLLHYQRTLLGYLVYSNDDFSVEIRLNNKDIVACTLRSSKEASVPYFYRNDKGIREVDPNFDIADISPQLRGEHDILLTNCSSKTIHVPSGHFPLRVNYIANQKHSGSAPIAEYGGLDRRSLIWDHVAAKAALHQLPGGYGEGAKSPESSAE